MPAIWPDQPHHATLKLKTVPLTESFNPAGQIIPSGMTSGFFVSILEVTMIYILNAFSINMLAEINESISVDFVPVSLPAIRAMVEEMQAEIVSAIGHNPEVYSAQLGIELPENRATVRLNRGDTAIVGQYVGERLKEGATTLPEGATIRWYHVYVV